MMTDEKMEELSADDATKIIFRMKSSVAREFKAQAARQGVSMQSVLQKAVETFLGKSVPVEEKAYPSKESLEEYVDRKRAQPIRRKPES